MKRSALPKQLSLDSLLGPSQSSDVEDKVIYNGIHVSQATFRAGLAASIHRWFRLTPSFGPDLVRHMLSTLKCKKSEAVLDPFAGAGTTMIECQLDGITSYGFELNPFLHFVGKTSLNWDLDPRTISAALALVRREFIRAEGRVTFDTLEEKGLSIPPIFNPTRWWRRDVLAKLLILRRAIEEYAPPGGIRDFLNLCLAGVLVPDLTNVTLGRLQLHFIDRSEDSIDVLGTFTQHCNRMIEDLNEIRNSGLRVTSEIINTDSTKLDGRLPERPINCVITSPPYPNRYSYTWNTRPHLYLLGFISKAREASDLDKASVGGTWGSATSDLYKGEVASEYEVVRRVVGPIVKEIRGQDNLMANYAMKYFNLLTKQIVSMDRMLASNARVAYVVGCSRLKGIFVETDVLLGKIFEGIGLGYSVSTIERIRRRHSGKDLHEGIVYAWKG